MPIYSWTCHTCKSNIEDIMKYEEMKKIAEVVCQSCTDKALTLNTDPKLGYKDLKVTMKKDISLIAKTATGWHGGWADGLSGNDYYSRSLGRHVANKRVEEKEMNKKGFVNVRDLGGKHWLDDKAEAMRKQAKAQSDLDRTYFDRVNEVGAEQAQQEVFNAKDCLDGKFDAINKNVLKD